MLGHRHGKRLVKTPELLSDGEVTRVIARPEENVEMDGDSAWTTPR